MKATKRIALAGISAALSTLFLIASVYVPIIDTSFQVLASLALLLPIAKNDYLGAFLAYAATSLLGFLTAGNVFKVLPYLVFFGPHPIILSLLQKFRIPAVIGYLIKLIFANFCIFMAIRFVGLAVDLNELFQLTFPIYTIYIAGSLVFLLYDWLMIRLKSILCFYIEKYTGKGRRS